MANNYTFKCTNKKDETFTADIFSTYYDSIIIENSNFINCEFIDCDFTKTKILKSNVDGCTFKNCIWSNGTNKLTCELSNIVNCKEEYTNDNNKFNINNITVIKSNIINVNDEIESQEPEVEPEVEPENESSVSI
jgi:uncharacterized protein YjbI with pentapeptide repeats